MNTADWDFDVDCRDVRAVYLCWRAVGEDVWDALDHAFRGVKPANWAFLYDEDCLVNND